MSEGEGSQGEGGVVGGLSDAAAAAVSVSGLADGVVPPPLSRPRPFPPSPSSLAV